MNFYPVITTLEPGDCRDFYVKAFGATVLFDRPWFVHLAMEGREIGFLRPDPPIPLPMFQHATPTRGLCFAIEVEDAGKFHDKLRGRGIETLGKPVQSQTGEITFSVMDPSGTILNIVEIKPDRSVEVVEL